MDVLRNLRQTSWRGIPFPIAGLKTDIQQRLAPHEMPDVDAERYEATGRKSIAVSGRAMFRNVGMTFDRVSDDPLYPNVHRAFLAAMADKSIGELIHPELGPINCRPVSASSILTAEIRDGADVDCAWIEALTDEEIDVFDGVEASVASLTTAASALDALLRASRNAAIKARFAAQGPTFSDLVRSVTRAAGTVGALSHRASRAGSGVIRQIDTMRSACASARDVSTAAIVTALERLESAVHTAQKVGFTGGRKLKTYIVPDTTTTLAALAARFKMPVDDLLRINPTLSAGPRVPQRSLVRYYT